ncbi:MAG: VOC family protein, partial [Mycobacteriaceae bacterium]
HLYPRRPRRGCAERHRTRGGRPVAAGDLQVHFDGQEEFDRYWYGLLDGGTPSKKGWLVDRFGVWWDIVPVQQMQIVSSAAPEMMPKLGAAMAAMERIDIAELERVAAEGQSCRGPH